MGKYYSINPETCTQEELLQAIIECENKADFYHTEEQAVKIFLNSIYGAIASKYYICNNISIAESITLQGQNLIKYSVNVINRYFREDWHADIETHRKIANKMKTIYPDFDVNGFLDRACSKPWFGDSCQIYGDSVIGSSLITIDNGEISIEELFNNIYTGKDTDMTEKIYAYPTNIKVACFDKNIQYLPIRYVMRHACNKNIFRITDECGNSVTATADHSIYVFRNNNVILTTPENIDPETDYLIVKEDDKVKNIKIRSIELVLDDIKYVYDIQVDTTDDNLHNFFANNILVHNTDSVSGNSIVRTKNHPDGISISEWYKENEDTPGEITLKGHESVFTEDLALNYIDTDNNIKYTPVKRIIRHAVSKPKWHIKTKSGKEIYCTGDHSIVVFRNGKKIVTTPKEILPGDQVLCI